MFGGKDKKGEPLNKLRLFKGSSIDGKIVHGEFVNIRGSGTPPCGNLFCWARLHCCTPVQLYCWPRPGGSKVTPKFGMCDFYKGNK